MNQSLPIPKVENSKSLGAAFKKAEGPSFFNPVIQPKLSINQPDDIYEQEADAMADTVMRMPENVAADNLFFRPAVTPIQRKCAHCEEEEKKLQRKKINNDITNAEASTENYIGSLDGKGRSLTEEQKQFFEPRFGTDFSDVRIHNDPAANTSAIHIQAKAYTHGNNIVFAPGQYSSETTEGKSLLAHELTHVIQQRGENTIQRKQFGSAVLLDAKPSCPPTAEVQQSNVTDEQIAEELYGDPQVQIDHIDEYNIHVNYAALQDIWKPYFEDCVPAEEKVIESVPKPPAEPEFIAADESYQLENHDIQGIPSMGIVARDKTPRLVLRETPSTSGKNLGTLDFNTRFQILDEPPGDWYHISTPDGRMGYVAKVYVKTNLPEPTSFLHRIEPGAKGTGIAIAEKYFHEEAGKWGMDLRFYINTIAYINKIRIPDTNDGWRQVQFKAGNFIWIPGKDFARSLKGIVNSGSVSYNAAEAIGVAEYIEGIVQKLEDFKNAILLSKKYIVESITRHIEEAILSAIVSLAEMILIAIAILAVSTAIGGAIGFLFGGAGAAPGAAIGFEVGMAIIEWMGLAMLIKWIGDAIMEITGAFVKFLVVVWKADGNLVKLDEGAKLYAEAIGTMLGKLVEAIVMFALAAGLGYAVGKLKGTKFGEKLGETALGKWLRERMGKKTGEEGKKEEPAPAKSEGELFEEQIKNEFAKKVIRENEPIYDEAGNQTGEIDFETPEALCEVGLSLDGKLPQLMREAELAKARAKRLDVFYDATRTPPGRLTAFKNSLGKRYGNRVRFIPKIFLPD